MNVKTVISVTLVLLSFGGVGKLIAQETPREALLILAKKDQTLAIVDPATLKVLKRLPVGSDPHEVIASTDGKTAYVSNYGFGAYNTLAIIDLAAQQPGPSVDLGPLRGPHGLTYVGGKTWFTAEAAKVIGRYDPKTKKVDWVLGTGQNRTHMIWVSPDQQRIITTNVSSATVSIIDKVTITAPGPPRGAPPGGPSPIPRTDWTETVIPVGRGSEGFDVSPDGKEVWVANAQDGTVSVIDIDAKKVSQTLEANVVGANRLKFTPDGKLVFISSLRGADVTVLDAATRKEVKRISVGHGAAGILMQPDGARVFIACSPDDYVTVIELKSLQVTGHIDAGHEPDGMAWAVQR
jgi:YVTN family beta-propeller protein